MAGDATRARTGIPTGRSDSDVWPLTSRFWGTRCHLRAFASPSSRASLHLRPVGSVACQPSHQIRIAATVINAYVTNCRCLATSRRAVRVADRSSAAPPASLEENVPKRRNQYNFTSRVALVSTSIPATSGHGGTACAPPNPMGAGGARRIMLRYRCEIFGEGLRTPVAPGTRENSRLRAFAINRQVGGDGCGLIHGAGGIRSG